MSLILTFRLHTWLLKAKSILTSNIRSTNFRRGYTCTAGSKAVDSSHTETKGRPSGQIKAKGRRVRVCDIFNVIKHVGLMTWFLFNNKMCDGSIICCSSNPRKRCSAVEAICYGKICRRIWSTYKNQISTKKKKEMVSVVKPFFQNCVELRTFCSLYTRS